MGRLDKLDDRGVGRLDKLDDRGVGRLDKLDERGLDERHQPGEEYAGRAEVIGPEGASIAVEVQLRGHFQPIDGRFHWYGRVAASDELAGRHQAGARIALRTPHGAAAGKIADVDPWGRFRVTGLGAPPF